MMQKCFLRLPGFYKEENRMLKWKRTSQGKYESSAQYWDAEANTYKPVYIIEKSGTGFILYVKDKIHIIEHNFSKLLEKEIAITHFATLKYAKKTAQLMEIEEPPYQTEEERGFSEGGGWSGAVWIDAEGTGGSWHTDINGYIIEG